ncbi:MULTISPECIES: spore coat protein [Alkalihalobacterium]|uniref:Spore coat protein n=1 Tax=Alkalihalobacterium chitinilyticum TaxID=2980103 RepID=A0ABT5V9F9_9BACI|nr:spore coat protein [Alkalihalobacterium chitinilyticum]MDE5412091.1 spore coat protein [Alkalihalobacterium chitinilyticum]MEB1806379.1 spore coat protein [Bacillaceae bacterium]
MNEKDMMNDYLSMINASLTTYANVISQTDNPQLRQTIQQMRNQDEARQYTVYNAAKQRGYYKPAAPAQPQEVQQVRSELSGQ